MNEIDAAYTWLASTLTGDATLRATVGTKWFRHLAPARLPGSTSPMTYPVGLYSYAGGRDTRGVGQYRVLTLARLDVRIVSLAGTDVSAAVSRLDTLLDVPAQAAPITSVTVDSVTYWILGCSRREPLSYATLEEGVVYEHAGGTYDLSLSR
jgi:hypothetical protein